ncbi:PLP-dependent aminotransferase family protein [Spiractinospora alimapuensis]|uniref:MocR-like pyridoxine biosynthesis transcription factor PdxR n=1 Tax=Spiractinospora alimapuensis TaxID=2820884 RepID=UPI001F1E42F6|nr:PLP-dependent aminotransferase family protein [Spiractinospora alimapuensis]QVQ54264.1 PLP-dependent aminotransferase family protein [Spiractinospora alimapuensis]
MRHAFPMNLVLGTDRSSELTARENLTERLRVALLSGQVAAHDPLPSTRSLAAATGLSRGTVVSVYEDLAGEGYVVSVPGSGTFVADDLPTDGAPLTRSPSREARRERRNAATDAPEPINLSPGSPSASFHTNRDWAAAWRTAVRREPPTVPPPPAGIEELRTLVADHLRTTRGVHCDAEDIVVTAGASDGFALLVHGIRPQGPTGTRIATENPGHLTARRVIARLGATPVPVPVRDGGMDPHALAEAPGPLAAALLTPSHQYPLGGRLPVAERLAMLAWAKATDAVVIEDDYDSEFRHGAPPLPAIASLDTDDRVVLVGSYSKTLTPWLRCGYLVVPDQTLRRRILDVRDTLGQPVSGVLQSAVAEFLRRGGLRRHLVRVGREYAHRRSLVIGATADLAPPHPPGRDRGRPTRHPHLGRRPPSRPSPHHPRKTRSARHPPRGVLLPRHTPPTQRHSLRLRRPHRPTPPPRPTRDRRRGEGWGRVIHDMVRRYARIEGVSSSSPPFCPPPCP